MDSWPAAMLHTAIDCIDGFKQPQMLVMQAFHYVRRLQAVQDLQNELDSLSSGCAAIDSALAANKALSSEFFNESEGLGHELDRNQQKSLLVQKFFDQYQLTPSEITALQVR